VRSAAGWDGVHGVHAGKAKLGRAGFVSGPGKEDEAHFTNKIDFLFYFQ
jgi:hypothetical protein